MNIFDQAPELLGAFNGARDLYVTVRDTLTEPVRTAWDKARNDQVVPMGAADMLDPIYAAFVQDDGTHKAGMAEALGPLCATLYAFNFKGVRDRAFEIGNAVNRYRGLTVAGEDPAIDPALAV